MFVFHRFLFSAVCMLAVCSCATPYQADVLPILFVGGYTDKKLGDQKYWIRFRGNSYTEMGEVIKNWEKRASELCGGRPYKRETRGFGDGASYDGKYRYPTMKGVAECESY